MRVGALTVDLVYDGYGDQVARDILQVPGKPDAWDKCGHYVDGAGNIQLICGGYLLRSGDRVVPWQMSPGTACSGWQAGAVR